MLLLMMILLTSLLDVLGSTEFNFMRAPTEKLLLFAFFTPKQPENEKYRKYMFF